jgi:hypothetical protein
MDLEKIVNDLKELEAEKEKYKLAVVKLTEKVKHLEEDRKKLNAISEIINKK